MSTRRPSLSVLAAGDVFSDLPGGVSPFRHLSPVLKQADIVFGNCEGVYCDEPQPAPSRKAFHGAPRERAAVLGEAPFHVMAVANNHSLDGGERGLRDTLDTLSRQGIQTVGAGENLDAALRPVVVEHQAATVAFVGFCAVFPVGYEASADRPGVAPLRIHTVYRSLDPGFWDPGTEPVIETLPDVGDRERFEVAIGRAAEQADIVIVSCHWGSAGAVRERTAPVSATYRRVWFDGVQPYEVELARAAIDYGAHAVVCHHHLSLRGIAFHRGRPIFHGLGILVNHFHRSRLAVLGLGGQVAGSDDDDGFPLFPFGPTARRGGLALLEFDEERKVSAGFLPTEIQADGSTEPIATDDPRAATAIAHLEALNQQSGFDTVLESDERDGWLLVRASPAGG